MKRGKSVASLEMKQVIAALCRLLTAAGLKVVPPPETFRRAKFGGGPDVVQSYFDEFTLISGPRTLKHYWSCYKSDHLRKLCCANQNDMMRRKCSSSPGRSVAAAPHGDPANIWDCFL